MGRNVRLSNLLISSCSIFPTSFLPGFKIIIIIILIISSISNSISITFYFLDTVSGIQWALANPEFTYLNSSYAHILGNWWLRWWRRRSATISSDWRYPAGNHHVPSTGRKRTRESQRTYRIPLSVGSAAAAGSPPAWSFEGPVWSSSAATVAAAL